MKYLAVLFIVAALAGLIWTVRVDGADGSWLACVVPAALAAGSMVAAKVRAGKWFTDEAGGH